jgi:hypothetical protein
LRDRTRQATCHAAGTILAVPDTTTTAVIIAVAGGFGAFLGASLTAGLMYRAWRTDRRREQQRSDAEAIGPVAVFLTDAHPDRLAFNARSNDEEQAQVMHALRDRLDASRPRLLVLATGHPRADVRKLAKELEVALSNAYTSAAWFVADIRSGGDFDREKALQDHGKAEALTDRLMEQIGRGR